MKKFMEQFPTAATAIQNIFVNIRNCISYKVIGTIVAIKQTPELASSSYLADQQRVEVIAIFNALDNAIARMKDAPNLLNDFIDSTYGRCPKRMIDVDYDVKDVCIRYVRESKDPHPVFAYRYTQPEIEIACKLIEEFKLKYIGTL